MSDLTAVSLFSGIGGIDEALRRAGVRVTASVEIDPAARSVLRRHFPESKIFNDVREVTGDQLRAAGFVPGRGILCGGFPCQDLSVAGRRAGLGGARSGLFWEIMRLADELSPRWLFLENVPGLLSAVCSCSGEDTCTANGRALDCGRTVVLRDGDRTWAEWLPNVPHAVNGGACPGGCMEAHGGAMGTVLGALGERGYGFAYRVLDAQFFGVPQRRNRVFIAGCLGDRSGPVEVLLEPEGGAGNPAQGRAPRPGTAGAPGGGAVSTLQGGGRRGHRVDAEGAAGGHLIAFDAAQITHPENRSNPQAGEPMPSIAATGQPMIAGVFPVALRGRESGSQAECGQLGDPAFTVRTPGGGSSYPMIAEIAGTPRSHPRPGSNSLGAMVTDAPMVFNPQTGGTKGRIGYGEIPTALQASQVTAVQTSAVVRRLTPMECERLQGFPDDWTRLLDDDSEQSDSARYRQCGNAVAVPVAEWIARRVVAVDQAREVRGAA